MITLRLLANVNVININKVRELEQTLKATLKLMYNLRYFAPFSLGFQSLRVKVTNDWKNKVAKIFLTEKAIALEEVVIRPFNLTGYLEVDSKTIPLKKITATVFLD
jgi:hypothetical protein